MIGTIRLTAYAVVAAAKGGKSVAKGGKAVSR